MNEEIKKQWVAALRSGAYKQGTGRLHDTYRGEDRFCCLGVLCDLAAREGVVNVRSSGPDILYDDEADVLPQSVMDWSGVESEDGRLTTCLPALALMNDQGTTFAQLADEIERYL
jgi:hypothetical protein